MFVSSRTVNPLRLPVNSEDHAAGSETPEKSPLNSTFIDSTSPEPGNVQPPLPVMSDLRGALPLTQRPSGQTAIPHLNLKFARWMLPSFNWTTNWRHVPAHAVLVFQT